MLEEKAETEFAQRKICSDFSRVQGAHKPRERSVAQLHEHPRIVSNAEIEEKITDFSGGGPVGRVHAHAPALRS